MGSAVVREDAEDTELKGGAGRGKLAHGVACTLIGGICWGLSGTCSKYLMSTYGIDPLWLVCVREIGACVLFIIAAFVKDSSRARGIFRDRQSLIGIVGIAFGVVLLSNVAYLETISWTNSATATVLQSLGIALILVYVCFSVRRRPKRREVIGVILAIVGTYLIATGGNPSRLTIPAQGLAWGALCALASAFLSILPTRLLGRWGSFVVNGYAMLISGVVLSAFVRPWEHMPSLDPFGLAVLAFVVVVGTFGAYALFLQGVKEVGSMRSGLLGTIEPVTATIASVLWLGTVFQPTELIGFAMIILMVYLTV